MPNLSSRNFAELKPEWALKEEVPKQLDGSFRSVSNYLKWVANIVPVLKKDR